MFKRLKEHLSETAGFTIIEYVIGMLVFVVFIAFCLDILFIATRYHIIGQEVGYVARMLSVQSGTTVETPHGFPGGERAYLSSGEIVDRIGRVAQRMGFEDGEWELYVEEKDPNGNVIRSGLLTEESHFPVDYLNRITVRFTGTYRWKNSLASSIPGINRERYMNIERVVMAEFIRNYDD